MPTGGWQGCAEGCDEFLSSRTVVFAVSQNHLQGDQLSPVLDQKPLSPLTANTCDSLLDRELQGQSNELSHVFVVKRESDFWVFWKLSNMHGFSDRLTRNEVCVIQHILDKKLWDFGGALNIPYATRKARKMWYFTQYSFNATDFLTC